MTALTHAGGQCSSGLILKATICHQWPFHDPWWMSLDLHGTWRKQQGSGEWIWTFRGSFKNKDCSVTSLEWTSFLTRLTGGGVRRCNDELAETRLVNKLVDSLTTFRRFSALRTLFSLQEHLNYLVSYDLMILDLKTTPTMVMKCLIVVE